MSESMLPSAPPTARAVLLLLAIAWTSRCVSTVRSEQADTSGIITGVVVDRDGHTVEGVRVCATPDGPMAMRLPIATSDNAGRFVLRGVPAGTVSIFTSGAEAGYPNTEADLFVEAHDLPITVQVSPGRRTNDVRVTLPERGGVLRGHVRDARTGQPVLTARLQLSRDDKPTSMGSMSLDANGGFVLALPRERNFTLRLQAEHYREWSSAEDPTVPTGTISLASGEELRLDIELSRIEEVP